MVSFAFPNRDVSVRLGKSAFAQSLFHIHLFDIVKFYANGLPLRWHRSGQMLAL